MSGSPPLMPALSDLRLLLSGARRLEDAWGATLELCILTLALPWETTSIDLDRIDWRNGIVSVPARAGATRILALPDAAMQTIQRIAGEVRGRGQAVTAGRGPRLEGRLFRLDRLMDRLASAAPETIDVGEWNFHGIRAQGALQLLKHGAAQSEIEAVLGRSTRRNGVPLRGDSDLACIGVERWCRILFADRAARS